MDAPVYEIRSLRHRYSGKTVLEIENLIVQPASIVGLFGPNGSGKSTLLKLFGLIDDPTEGEIRYGGRPMRPFADEARFQITLLPQEPLLLQRSVGQNVAYGLRLRGNGGETEARVDEALGLVGLSGREFAGRPWTALSAGETQRVALAARLALEPKVLLLDEPTASVDAASAQLIKEAALRARRQWGTTLVIASHDWQWLAEICDEVLHLFRGHVLGPGRQTILFGPWKELGDGRWGRALSDQQLLVVPRPPDPAAAGVVTQVTISQSHSGSHGEVILGGTVSRLNLERKTGDLLATIVAGDLPFTVRLTPRQAQEHGVVPGENVSIRYRLDQVQWI